MKVEIIFLTAVLGIAAIHLLTNLVNFLCRFKQSHAEENHKVKMRNDWYMFFDKKDLYGDTNPVVIEPVKDAEAIVESNPACDDCQPQEAFA